MKSKTFEVRDKGTFIPVLATKLVPMTEQDGYLLWRSGFKKDSGAIVLWRLQGGPATSDQWDWGGRTMGAAHEFIQKNWDMLESGDVIDVEYILGETTVKKHTENESIVRSKIVMKDEENEFDL